MLCPSCGQINPERMSFCGKCGTKFAPVIEDGPTDELLTSADFVGRQRELGELAGALDDAMSGKGRMVMLVGEPGIGKTRTAEELAAVAEQRGAQVLWGRCYERGGAPSYWPWVQVIRAYIQDRDTDHLRSVMGAGASEIAEIVPQLRERLPKLEPNLALDSPEANRFRLFDSVTTFLKNTSSTSGGQPLVLILDNLHWADKPSLLLLEFLSQEFADNRVLIVGTYRDVDLNRQHPLSETLGELTRARLFQRIVLRGLSLEDEGRYFESASGVEPSREFVERLHSHTEGSPLFVGEVVRMLQQEGQLTPERLASLQDRDLRIPEGVREVIGRRLNRLSEDCNRVLTIASVIGREFTFEHLVGLVEDITEDDLLDALDEALLVRLIEEQTESAGSYQFSHALVQRTLRDELSTTRRVRLHARIAETLEKLYAEDVESHASELAYHFGEAEIALGSEKVVKYSKIAGERALAASAYEDALEHFERAMGAKEGQGVDDETATILFGLGRARLATFATAQAQEAVDTLRRAFDAFVDLGDTENAVAAATHIHGFLAYSSGTANMTARALDLIPSDSIEAGYLLSHHGSARLFESKDYEGAQENLDRAVEIARREGDRVLEIRTLGYIAFMHWVQEHYREAVEGFLPVIELAQSIDELLTLVRARFWCADALLSIGDGKEAQIHATAGLKAAERLHDKFWLLHNLRHNIILAILRGEWNVAQEFIARVFVESPRDATTLAVGALLNLQVGNLEESSEYIKQILEVVPNAMVGAGMERPYAAAAIPLFARVTSATELLDVAESTAKGILSSPSVPSIFISMTRVGLALIAIQRSDSESATEQYSILESRRGTQLFAVICYDRLLGLLAQTMGNLDDAQSHFEDALAFCRRAGYRTELAWSCYDYATLRQARGEPNEALAILDEAQSISTELGMRPLMEKVTALREQVESRPAKAPAYPDGLTEREVEVLRLVAAGRSNREIGEELFIALNTVARHVSNIFAKTDSANRAEAATYANQHDLLQ